MQGDLLLRFRYEDPNAWVISWGDVTVYLLPTLDPRPWQRALVADNARAGTTETQENRTVTYIADQQWRVYATELRGAQREGSWADFAHLKLVKFLRRELLGIPDAPSPPLDDRTAALWDDVVAALDDDGPRLVLADHLMMQNDRRGELIHLQCRIAKGEALDDFTIDLDLDCDYKLVRGFVDSVRCDATTTPHDLRRLCAHHEMRTATGLRLFEVRVDIGELVAALRGNLRNVRRLAISRARIGDAGAIALLDHPFTDLGLDTNNITDAGAIAIATRAPSTLRHLELSYNDIGARGIVELAKLPLESLHSIRNPLGPDGLQFFKHLSPHLRDVDLSWCGLGAFDEIAVGALRELDLCGDDIGDRGAAAIARADLSTIQRMQLGNNRITDRGVEALCNAKLPALKVLRFENNPITDAGLDRLLETFPGIDLGVWGDHQISQGRYEAFKRDRRERPRSR